MFCEESLGKINFRAFPKRVGRQFLSLESIDYFGASEHYWVVEKKIRIWNSKIAMVGCRKLSLYAKWVSGWACDLFSAMIEKICRVNHFFDILQWCYFSGIEAFELKSIEVDKVESKKHLASKSVSFRVQLIASSFLDLIFKQGRLNPP